MQSALMFQEARSVTIAIPRQLSSLAVTVASPILTCKDSHTCMQHGCADLHITELQALCVQQMVCLYSWLLWLLRHTLTDFVQRIA